MSQPVHSVLKSTHAVNECNQSLKVNRVGWCFARSGSESARIKSKNTQKTKKKPRADTLILQMWAVWDFEVAAVYAKSRISRGEESWRDNPSQSGALLVASSRGPAAVHECPVVTPTLYPTASLSPPSLSLSLSFWLVRDTSCARAPPTCYARASK